MSEKDDRPKREVWCYFAGFWVPLEGDETHCPKCGAKIGTARHETRTKKV